MRSKANNRNNSVYPFLIPIPIALLIGVFILDLGKLIFLLNDRWVVGSFLSTLGIITAVMAAIPSILDYYSSFQQDSAKRKKTLKLALANISAMIIFGLVLCLKSEFLESHTLKIFAIEQLAVFLLVFGSWQGKILPSKQVKEGPKKVFLYSSLRK